jgi:hypothetical protein
MPGTGTTSISASYIAALNKLAAGKDRLITASRAEVWSGETKLATLTIEASSTVTVDRSNLSRTTCSLVLTDPFAGTDQAIVPETAGDLLYPVGNELVVYNGITYPDGTQELIQLGVFGLIDADFDDGANDLVITLIGSDRSVACQHAGFTSAYTIPPGTNVGVAIQTLLASLQTGLAISYAFTPTDSVTPTTPIVYLPGDDPFAKANDLATSIGNELFFAPTGVCTMIPVPDPTQAGVSWDYVEGANLAKHIKRHVSRTNAPNYIICVGSGPGIAVPFQAVAQDTNPLSATWVGGKYGQQVAPPKTSGLYATQAEAQADADAQLLLALGTIESVEIQAMPKPDTQPDDVVSVTRARSGLTAVNYVIDSFTLGFGNAGVLDFVARQVPS